MYQCTKNPEEQTMFPCNKQCPYYWACVKACEEQDKKEG